MDDHEESILIPVREYENYRNILSLQDKQSVIRDLQHLLITKDEDLKRYKEKWEQTELVLKRTQKALDKRIQTEQTQISLPLRPISRPQPGSVQLTRPVARTRPQPAAGVQVISRALGEVDPIKSDMPSASLPHQASRPNFMDDTSSLKSLPLNLGIGTPGMSTALLRRLVQENLKLKQHFDRGQNPKASKVSTPHIEVFISCCQAVWDGICLVFVCLAKLDKYWFIFSDYSVLEISWVI